MKDKERLYSIIKEIGIVLIIVLLFFGSNLSVQMAADTYVVDKVGFTRIAEDAIVRNGRVITGIFYYLAGAINQSIESFYYVSFIFAIVFTILSIWILEDKILKDVIENKFLRILLSVIVIINPFYIEYFMFLEMFSYAFSVCCAIIAMASFIKFLKTNKKKFALYTCVALILSAFTYQTTTALFIGIGIPFIFYYSKSIKSYFKNLAILSIVYIISMGLNVIFATIVDSARMSYTNEQNILNNIGVAIKEIVNISYHMFEILPNGMFSGILLLIIIISIGMLIKKEHLLHSQNWLKVIYGVLNIIIIILFMLFSSTSSVILGAGWYIPRIIYPWASCVGILCINFLINILKEDNIDKKDWLSIYKDKIIFCICLVLLLMASIQYVSFQKIIIDKHKNTELDKYRIEIIGNEIQKYEQENDVKIDKIAFYLLRYDFPQYSGLFNSGGLVVSSFNSPVSDLNAINYYLGTSYTRGENKEEYFEKFMKLSEKTAFSFEHLIFDDDTLHILVY